MAPQQPVGGALDAFAYFQFDLVRWELLPSLFPTWLGMYVVVAFSSSLDVAAIQMDMGKQLDFNHELITVGISNTLSGLLGGFTGSYIFSQTIFTFRTGTRSRVCARSSGRCGLCGMSLPIAAPPSRMATTAVTAAAET